MWPTHDGVLAPTGGPDSIEITDQGQNLSLYDYTQQFFTAPWHETLVAAEGNAYA